MTIAVNRNLSNCEKARKKGISGLQRDSSAAVLYQPVEAPKSLFYGLFRNCLNCDSLRWSHTHFICIPAVHIISFYIKICYIHCIGEGRLLDSKIYYFSPPKNLVKLAKLTCKGLVIKPLTSCFCLVGKCTQGHSHYWLFFVCKTISRSTLRLWQLTPIK